MLYDAKGSPVAPALVGGLGFYFTGEDWLRVTSWNSLASVRVVATGRFLTCAGDVVPLSRDGAANTDRTAATFSFRPGDGWLQDLSLIVTGAAPVRGQTFVRVDVVRGDSAGAAVLSTLIQGYVTATKRLAWPGSPIEDSLAGQGWMRSFTGTDPAANTEVSETVPTGARWRFLSAVLTLVTDATVANRSVRIFFDDGANVYCRGCAAGVQPASATQVYNIGDTGFNAVADAVTDPVPVPSGLRLLAGHRIRSSTANIQAGDNYSAIQMLVEEWLEPA